MLEKKIKALKFRKSRFGKVGLALTRVGAKLTQPAKKTKAGKNIPGTGGLGARVMSSFSQPSKKKVPMRNTVSSSPMETAFATPVRAEQQMANLDMKLEGMEWVIHLLQK